MIFFSVYGLETQVPQSKSGSTDLALRICDIDIHFYVGNTRKASLKALTMEGLHSHGYNQLELSNGADPVYASAHFTALSSLSFLNQKGKEMDIGLYKNWNFKSGSNT